MPLRRLKNIYEKRRSTLKNILDDNRTMDKDRKAEMIGAISEIDTLIKTIETLRSEEIEDNRLLEVKGRSTVLDNIPVLNKFNLDTKNKFEDSGTKHSLNEAFVKKSEASTKYNLYGEIARIEGYENIAQIFFETSKNELEQAQIIMEYMKESKGTLENLKSAADNERTCHNYYFTHYEKVASREKYPQIVEFFKDLSQIDAEHEKRFLKLLKNFNDNKVFKKDILVKWKCKGCGYIVEAHEAPAKCKVCKKPRGKFEIHYDVF